MDFIFASVFVSLVAEYFRQLPSDQSHQAACLAAPTCTALYRRLAREGGPTQPQLLSCLVAQSLLPSSRAQRQLTE